MAECAKSNIRMRMQAESKVILCLSVSWTQLVTGKLQEGVEIDVCLTFVEEKRRLYDRQKKASDAGLRKTTT